MRREGRACLPTSWPGADLPLAVSVVVVLQLVNIVAVPVWAGQVVIGATISAWDIVTSLLALVLLPLVAGLFIRARYADHAKDWQPELVKAANLALVIALATGIAANWSTIVSMFGSWVGAQLHGNPVYLGPAITFALGDFILPVALAVEIGRRAGATAKAPAP